jgi:hypothetical protein
VSRPPCESSLSINSYLSTDATNQDMFPISHAVPTGDLGQPLIPPSDFQMLVQQCYARDSTHMALLLDPGLAKLLLVISRTMIEMVQTLTHAVRIRKKGVRNFIVDEGACICLA